MSVVIRYASLFYPDDQLITQSELVDEICLQKCPVYNHRQDRTFVGVSPIDFNLRVGRMQGKSTIYCNEPELLAYDEEHIFLPNQLFN